MNKNEQHCMETLDIMLKDGMKTDHLYSPTPYWSICCDNITEEIKRKGVFDFRCHTSANRHYVPLYAKKYYREHSNLIDTIAAWLNSLPYKKAGSDLLNHLKGWSNAFSDYCVFRAADIDRQPHLSSISESTVGAPPEQFTFEGKNYSLSFLNYLKGLVFLKKNITLGPIHRALEIGGGYGTLGEILLKADSNALYIDVDLPPVAAVATYYLREVFGETSVLGYDQTREWEHIDIDKIPPSCRAVILCPWQLPKLNGKIDLFANFISFQEMEPDVVQNYIHLVQRHEPEYILMRNLREGKRKKTAPDELGVKEPILLEDMISWFDQYREIARDTISFGELKIDNFHSEIAALIKK